MFGRPAPVKGSAAAGGGAKGGAGGTKFRGKGEGGSGSTPKGNKFEKRGFEKRMEYQNPEAFAGVEVRGGGGGGGGGDRDGDEKKGKEVGREGWKEG